MKIFVVGATGYIGGSVAEHLRKAGHEIVGLARTEEKAAGLRARGIEPLIGTFDDKSILAQGAETTDATINVADSDRLDVAETLIETLAGTGKVLLHTSGSSIVVDDAQGDASSDRIFEDDAPYTPMSHRLPRIAVDTAIRTAGVHRGIRAAVICPTMVYGQGRGMRLDSDQIPKIVAKSRARGAGVHIGKGVNVWSNVFIDDLSLLYVLALDKAPAGAFFFAENGEKTLRGVAEAVSHSLGFNGKTESWDLAEATAELGAWPRIAIATNCRVRSTNARRLLGWNPTGPSLTDAIKSGT
jgi:nucleoside-diphosphate-sugar epimerase